jgi:GNAT superfamily N-acetyltransferase
MTSLTVVLTPLQVEHVEQIALLYHDIWHETQARLQPPQIAAFRNHAFFVARMKSRAGRGIVATLDSKPIGFASWQEEWIDGLFIDGKYRRQGLGGRLLQETERQLARKGHRELLLHCLAGNDAARIFYEIKGWSVYETIRMPIEHANGSVDVRVWNMSKSM